MEIKLENKHIEMLKGIRKREKISYSKIVQKLIEKEIFLEKEFKKRGKEIKEMKKIKREV